MATLRSANGWQRSFTRGAFLIAVMVSVGHASANGRFPRAQRLLEAPGDPDHLVLSATYGMLVTHDGGGDWRYVCEAAYGETDLPIDALTAFTPERALLAGIFSGISRAAESPCDFTRTLGRSNREAVPDFALSASRPGRVLAILVAIPEQGAPFTQLYRSDDDGRSFAPLGQPLPPALRTALTLDIAPSDDSRVYVSGLGQDDQGLLLRSDDGGESFVSFELSTDPAQQEYPYVAAIDAENADRIYVRTDAWRYDPATSTAEANDALLISEDGGEHFSEALRAGGKLFGFALSPDREELLVGYGDPLEAGGSRFTDPAALGIYRGTTTGASFVKRWSGSVNCLTWSERVYVCTHESETGFSLGRVDAALLEASGAELEPLLSLAEVAGPVNCPGCSAAAVCRNYWESTCQSWGRQDCQALDAPECESAGGAAGAGGPSAAPSSGAPSTDGGARASGDAGEPGSSGGSGALPLVARGGCACRAAPGAGVAHDTSVLALTLVLALVRRRRRARGIVAAVWRQVV